MQTPHMLSRVDFEERVRVLGPRVFETIDEPTKRSEPAPKTLVVEVTSVVPKSGKTTQTQHLSSSLRAVMGSGLRVVVVPEGAEDRAIRAMKKQEADIVLARYLSYVFQHLLDLSRSREFHAAILDRSIIDHLIWQEFFARAGEITREHRNRVWDYVLSGAWVGAIDAIFYLHTDIHTALEREKKGVSIGRVGSMMNEDSLPRFCEAAEVTLGEVSQRMPELPIFRIDTGNQSEEETNAQITLALLETLNKRLGIDRSRTVPYSLSLMRKEVEVNGKLQVQLKLKGHPWPEGVSERGWVPAEEVEQIDTYCVFLGGVHPAIQPGEIIRIRKVGDKHTFSYKGVGVENTVTRRPHLNIPIDERQVQDLMNIYSVLAVVTKKPRIMYERQIDQAISVCDKVYLCVDTVKELGEFTEISMYANEYHGARSLLLEEAGRLGFSLADIVEGNYLKMVLEGRERADAAHS